MANLVSSNDASSECNSEYKHRFVECSLFSHYASSKQTLEIEDLIFQKIYFTSEYIYLQPTGHNGFDVMNNTLCSLINISWAQALLMTVMRSNTASTTTFSALTE